MRIQFSILKRILVCITLMQIKITFVSKKKRK